MLLTAFLAPLILAIVGANAKADVKDASTGPPDSGPVKTDGGGGLPTTFDGQSVPEIQSIEADGPDSSKFADTIRHGYW